MPRADWFDGRTSGSRPVHVRLEAGISGPSLSLLDPTDRRVLLVLDHRQLDWPERWGSRVPARLTVDLRDQGSLVIEDVAGWESALAAAGHKPSLAQRMQTRWGTLLGVLLVAALALGAFYRWGTPWAATQLTRHVPVEWEHALTAQAMVDLDGRFLKPSKVPADRQAALRARFDALAATLPPTLRRYPRYAPTLRLEFRSGFGANAFALPGGLVVMTDGMVAAADKHGLGDDALVGVLAHEIGHVMSRHTTRMVVEQAVLNVGLGLALGDVSSMLSTGASLLTGLAYRRGHETEADCFAIALLKQASVPATPMGQLLVAVERDAAKGKEPESAGWAELLSSHPDTAARASALREGDPAVCR